VEKPYDYNEKMDYLESIRQLAIDLQVDIPNVSFINDQPAILTNCEKNIIFVLAYQERFNEVNGVAQELN